MPSPCAARPSLGEPLAGAFPLSPPTVVALGMARPVYNRLVLGIPPDVAVQPQLLFEGSVTAQVEDGVFTLRWEIFEFGLVCITASMGGGRQEVYDTVSLYRWGMDQIRF